MTRVILEKKQTEQGTTAAKRVFPLVADQWVPIGLPELAIGGLPIASPFMLSYNPETSLPEMHSASPFGFLFRTLPSRGAFTIEGSYQRKEQMFLPLMSQSSQTTDTKPTKFVRQTGDPPMADVTFVADCLVD